MLNTNNTLNINLPRYSKLISFFKDRESKGIGVHFGKTVLKLHGSSVYQKHILNTHSYSSINNLNVLANKVYNVNLKKNMNKKINFILKLKNYRAERHSKSLPVRGQRTKTNAKTRKHRSII